MVWTICAGKVDFKRKTLKIFRAEVRGVTS